MAHLHQRHLSDYESGAIFSPTVARIAASTARDWSYVDSWLASKLPATATPSFERNPDTLRALLALAASCEAADEQRALLARAEAEALREVEERRAELRALPEGSLPRLREDVLDALEEDLPREGKTALDALATMSIQPSLSVASSSSHPGSNGSDRKHHPEQLGRQLVRLQASTHETAQMHDRVEILHRHIRRDADATSTLLSCLSGEDFRPPPAAAKENLELQRKVKAASAQLPDLQDRVAALAAAHARSSSAYPTLEDMERDEDAYMVLLEKKKQLDAQLAIFQGLPSDPDVARRELDGLRQQLRGATSQRDAVFEGLVERESPVKTRRR
ncbi:hypothetical protein N3K66_001079 [Trichothecium roseum]|uniref:Uncharacterized protein n=1 Tax=Trichothecium roseum TaxID=47278 RepID=A0ACC0VFQ8_9HYPO|nr:hypothetical protein N3K66_001079 [Trichothecium roseum]